MKLVTYRHPAHGYVQTCGVLQGDRVLSVFRLLERDVTFAMLDLLEGGPEQLAELGAAADRFAQEHVSTVQLPRETAVPAWEAELSTPVPNPPSIRDFYAFEQHVGIGYRARGKEIPAAWYEAPVFYFAHTGNLYGPEAVVPKPDDTMELDFELELAVVIGREGRDIAASDAWSYVAGFTIMNDWSARDIQRAEMSLGLGPAKGKDFATSFGPCIVTLDELGDRLVNDQIRLEMIARVNGEETSRANAADMHWTFPRIIERASRGATLRPGDLIGSGTCGSGCIFELGPENVPWLEPGDEIELEIEGIGRLRNTVG